MFTKAIVLTVGVGAMAIGCGTDQQAGSADEHQEIVDNLVQAGYPVSEIRIFEDKVYVGNDAEVNLQASREMIDVDTDGHEQYRTTNLLGTNITNVCINGAAFTGTFSTALTQAIANYNGLGLRFRMTRTSGATTGCSATITARVSTGTGGVSGFPSGGRPFNTINIGSGLRTGFSVNTVAHVITHEIGHTLGMRHSDFFNRSISCGGAASNEGNGGVGAILIPGTPSGATTGGSVMNSCFRQNETGRFTATDRTAWTTVY